LIPYRIVPLYILSNCLVNSFYWFNENIKVREPTNFKKKIKGFGLVCEMFGLELIFVNGPKSGLAGLINVMLEA
jgi:hypothetical protein